LALKTLIKGTTKTKSIGKHLRNIKVTPDGGQLEQAKLVVVQR